MEDIENELLPEFMCGECKETIPDDFVFYITFEKDDQEFVVNFCQPCSENLMKGPRRRGKD